MIVQPFPIPDDWPRSAAIDFGFNHPTAAVWLARDPDGVYYLYQEYRKAGDLLANHARAINAISGQLLPSAPGEPVGPPVPIRWYADPSAKQAISEMRRLGIPLVPADNDVLAGIDTLSTLMATGRFRVFRTCQHWLDEVEGYVWDTHRRPPPWTDPSKSTTTSWTPPATQSTPRKSAWAFGCILEVT